MNEESTVTESPSIINNAILIAFSALIALFVLFIIVLSIWGVSKDKGKNLETKVQRLLKVWLAWSMAWVLIDYALSVFSFIASILAISIVAQDIGSTYIIVIYSTISATMVVINFATNPKKQASCYRKAFEILDYAFDGYICKKYTDLDLYKAIHKGEKEISKTYGAK